MSIHSESILEELGVAVGYPTNGYRSALADCERHLKDVDSEAACALGAFRGAIADLEEWELQELYTRTFDLNPVCTLEVGWHLYGEQYRRGRFLVKTRDLLSKVGIEERGELPDHLMSLLPALARLDPGEAAVLAGSCLAPAVQKMLAGLEGKDNPYEQVLKAVQLTLGPSTVEPDQLAQPIDQQELIQIGHPQASSFYKGTVS